MIRDLARILPSPSGNRLYALDPPPDRSKCADYFAQAADETGYNGRFLYAYASKANAAEEVVRTTLGAGAHHEMSSTIDVDIARIMIGRGLLNAERLLICNGFKAAGSAYMDNIIRIKDEHENVIPVLEEIDELAPLIKFRQAF